MKKKVILFDYDGTLMDTREGIVQSWRYVFKKLKNEDVTNEYLRQYFGKSLKGAIAEMFPDKSVDEVVAVYKEFALSSKAKRRELFYDAKETVQRLHKDGYVLGLVTSRMHESSVEGLTDEGLIDYFSVIVASDDVEEIKPSAEPIERAMDILGVSKEDVVMVGDTEFDLGSAKNADVTSALVGWSDEREMLINDEKFAPDYIINKFEDLYNIV